jgi:oligopeptide/dipeptide ABC transporter ATP-binding protein
LRRLADERRLAILLITHDLTSAAANADRVLTLYAGRVVEAGPTAAVLAAPAHPYTHLLLSAVPRGDRLPLVGDAPAAPPDAASGGCPFFNRCPHAGAACRDRAPALVPVAAEHEVRCHLFSAQGAAPHASLS